MASQIALKSGTNNTGVLSFNGTSDTTLSLPNESGTLATQGYVDGQALGVGQTWQAAELTNTGATFTDGTAKFRASNTNFTNSSGRSIQVAVSVDSQASSQYFIVNGINVLSWDATVAEVNHGCIIIPNGAVYSINATQIIYWSELR